jgi:hypothetical protein
MICSKIIPVTLATFCCLAFQLQASGANAQTATGIQGQEIYPEASLSQGNSLYPGFAMRTYTGYLLVLQQDGNLVLYSPSMSVLWSTGTYGNTPLALTMQTDGNLVLYGYPWGTSGMPPQQLWASNTSGSGGCANYLNLKNGALAILSYLGCGANPGIVAVLYQP